MHGCATPLIPRSSIRQSVPISRPRTPSSSATMAPHASGRSKSARRAQGADQGGRPLGPGARGRVRVSLAVLSQAPSTGPGTAARWRPTRPTLILDEIALAAGQELLQPARARGQPRRPAARLHHRRGRLRALPAAPAAIWRPARRAGRSGHQHLGLGRVGRGRAHAALCRAQRPAAAVPGPRPPAGRRSGRRRRALRGGRPRLLRLDRQDAQPPASC